MKTHILSQLTERANRVLAKMEPNGPEQFYGAKVFGAILWQLDTWCNSTNRPVPAVSALENIWDAIAMYMEEYIRAKTDQQMNDALAKMTKWVEGRL